MSGRIEEWGLQLILKDGSGGQVIFDWFGRKYTREAAQIEATPGITRVVHRFVTEWEEPA